MDIKMILEKHAAWLRDEDGGELANLSWANLSGANLTGANLSGANLTEANLSWANLSDADLTGANLSGADLTWADLTGANLSWANLTRANLTDAKGVYQFGPMPTSGRLCRAIWEGAEWTIYAGCFKGNCDELEAKVLAEHKCPVYLANIALLRAWKYETK